MNYALKYNYAYFEELRLKNPAAYSEWYQRNYAQRYTPTVVTGGTGTALGSIAASEADRASVHSGRSSVNEDHPSMLANHSISQQLRGSTTGLDQSLAYDYSLYQVRSVNCIDFLYNFYEFFFCFFKDENPALFLDYLGHDASQVFVFACHCTLFSWRYSVLRLLPNSPY